MQAIPQPRIFHVRVAQIPESKKNEAVTIEHIEHYYRA